MRKRKQASVVGRWEPVPNQTRSDGLGRRLSSGRRISRVRDGKQGGSWRRAASGCDGAGVEKPRVRFAGEMLALVRGLSNVFAGAFARSCDSQGRCVPPPPHAGNADFPSLMQFEHGFDFHGDVVRERSHTDGAAGSFSGFAEDFHHGVTEPVHHSWVALEVGS